MRNKIYICSFASDDLNASKKRFIKQSSLFYNKENIKIYNVKDLHKETENLINKNLFKENRAYGYGIWKPYIVLDFFDKLPIDSILQYADIGCHFNLYGEKRFSSYIKLVDRNKSLVFEYDGKKIFTNNKNIKFQKYFEFQYSKKDLIKYLKIKHNSKILRSPQIWSGSFFLKKNQKNRNFLVNWLKIMKKNHLIDATISKNPEDPNFVESRWDQSVFSILSKKNNFFKISASECEWAENGKKRIWFHLEKYPIIAKRDLKRNFISRFINRQKRTYRRYNKKFKIWRDGRAV